MITRIFLPLTFAAITLLGCGRADVTTAAMEGVARVVNEVSISTGTPVTTADLSIEGMSCEMMCGGSIKKALAALGVEATEIKMSEGDAPDHAIVTYNESKVTDAQMVEAIQKLYDGQYKVKAVNITKQVLGSAAAKSEGAKGEEEKGVSAYASSRTGTVLTGVLAVLTRILRN
ncbi:MAG: heavy-metal-associated domain-containing protein [Flavobacteriales bacterium]